MPASAKISPTAAAEFMMVLSVGVKTASTLAAARAFAAESTSSAVLPVFSTYLMPLLSR